MKIGQNIRRIRKQRGLTIQQLADTVGCDAALMQKYETGDRNPKADRLELIAKGLEVSPDTLAYSEFKGERAMHWLFLLFSMYEGTLKKEDGEDGTSHYYMELPRLTLMKEWYLRDLQYRSELQEAENIEDTKRKVEVIASIREDYQHWMDSFPTGAVPRQSLADQSTIDFLLSTLWGENKPDNSEIADMLDKLTGKA